MLKKPMPTQAELKKRFSYDSLVGRLVYLEAPSRNQPQRVGTFAGSKHCEGGWSVSYRGKCYLHCRLVWVWYYGQDPGDNEIDHIDGDRSNDRIENLRLATRAQQQWNIGVTKKNSSGMKGVSFYKRLGLWRADIRVEGRQKNLGYFKNKADAAAAYKSAALALHGEFTRLK
jgi:hypothetical protein